MVAVGIVEKLILGNPTAIVGLFIAVITWFRGFKWWVLLPVGFSFIFSNFAGLGLWALIIMAVCGTGGKEKGKTIIVDCPKCGRWLKGATREMIGDTGVCPKCKAEFVIKQEQ